VRASIVARSDQLNADDLIAGPVTVTITGVRKGDHEQPIHIDVEEFPDKSYRPCKTCRRILIAVYGDKVPPWIGQRLTLYCDPAVKYGGVAVGGIRISHMTGLQEVRTFMLAASRGKKTEITIRPLAAAKPAPALSAGEAAFLNTTVQSFAKMATVEELESAGNELRDFLSSGDGEKMSAAAKESLRKGYSERLSHLKSQPAREREPGEEG
jgi:hypothetical protein